MGPAYFNSPVEAWICKHTHNFTLTEDLFQIITSNLWQEELKEKPGVFPHVESTTQVTKWEQSDACLTSDLQETFDALSRSHDGCGEHARQHPSSKQLWIPAGDKRTGRIYSQISTTERLTGSSQTVATRDKAITYVRISSGVLCCSFFPSPNPKKQTANMGVTPIMGAAIPL